MHSILEQSVAIEKTSSPEFVRRAFTAWARGKTLLAMDQPQTDLFAQVSSKDFARIAPGGGWIEPDLRFADGEWPAQVSFTSGTTGTPKPVVLGKRALVDVTDRLCNIMEMSSDVREYIAVPVTFSFGLGRARAVAAVGGRAYLPEVGFRPSEVAEMLAADRINALSAVPTMLRLVIAQRDLFDGPGRKLQWLEIGSQFMSGEEKETIRTLFPNARIAQHYGLTEASRSTFLRIDAVERDALESVGEPTGDVQIRVNEDNRIQIRGPHVADGIISENDLIPLVDVHGWLTTNDLGSIDDAGRLHYHGRVDDQVNISGVKVAAELFEEALTKQIASRSGTFAVAPVKDSVRGEALVVGYLDADTRGDLLVALPSVARRFGISETDITVRQVSEIPRTTTGKVQRRLLAEAEGVGGDRPNKEQTKLSLAQRMAVVLARPEIDESKSYVDLGADSLSYVQVALLVEERLGKLPEDWETIPISNLRERELPFEERAAQGSRQLEPEYIMRAIAIIGVVTTHALWTDLRGGAYLLFLLAGTAFAKFQLPKIADGGKFFVAFRPLIRILAGYYLVLGFYQIVRGEVAPEHWLLVANFFPELQSEFSLLPYYWFIAAFCQSYVLAALAFAGLVKWGISRQTSFWTVSVLLLLATFLVSLITGEVVAAQDDVERYQRGHFTIRTPMSIFYVFAFGICAAFADTTWRRAFLSLFAMVTFPMIGVTSITLWLLLGTIILLWGKPLQVSPALCTAIVAIASASLYIFLVHMFPVQVYRELGAGNLAAALGVIASSVIAGIVMMKLIAVGEMQLRKMVSHA